MALQKHTTTGREKGGEKMFQKAQQYYVGIIIIIMRAVYSMTSSTSKCHTCIISHTKEAI